MDQGLVETEMAHLMRCFFVVFATIASTLIGQEPTAADKSQFEDWFGDFVMDEVAMKKYCVKYSVVASVADEGETESIEQSEGFLAVDKEQKRVRYDFISSVLNEEGKESANGIRHLQLDKDFYFGQGKSYPIQLYRLSKSDRNFLKNWDGRPVNPMLLPFSGMNSSRNSVGVESLFGFDSFDPIDVRAAWSDARFLTGCFERKTDSSVTCTFDKESKRIVCTAVYLHPKSMAMDKPGTRFPHTLKTEIKWKEVPKLGLLPAEVVDFVNLATATGMDKRQITTKVTWFTEEIPEEIFLPEDLKLGLEFPSKMQMIFAKKR